LLQSVIEGNNAFSQDTKITLIRDQSAEFTAAFASGVSEEVAVIVREVFSNPSLLNARDAQNIKSRLEVAVQNGKITQDQSAALTRFFLKRSIAIITQKKTQEEERLVESFRYADSKGISLFVAGRSARNAVIDKIRADRDTLIQQLNAQAERLISTQAQQRAEEEARRRANSGTVR
jgi:hypothetical protein